MPVEIVREAKEVSDEGETRDSRQEVDRRENKEDDLTERREEKIASPDENRGRKKESEPLRRSSREKKMPSRYDEYQLYSCTRPIDHRFHALESIMGTLSTMDIDMARRVITEIMK